ncbi:transcriptional regulator FilR1 domain-containing protein [Methanobrevibacter sp.]
MKTNSKHVKYYNAVAEDVKFVAKSILRLKILNALYERPSDMKELTLRTNLNYSSVSTVLHSLELKNMVYRKSKKFYLVNSIKLQMKNIIELAIVINLLEEIFNIIQDHIVKKLPHESVIELHLLEQAKLIESHDGDADKIYDIIKLTLDEASSVRCILPVYYDEVNARLNNLEKEKKFVEIKVSNTIYSVYKQNSKVKYFSTFAGKNNFLLIITNDIMILGFFKKDQIFDKNRILISKSRDSLKWANNLFRYFKQINK